MSVASLSVGRTSPNGQRTTDNGQRTTGTDRGGKGCKGDSCSRCVIGCADLAACAGGAGTLERNRQHRLRYHRLSALPRRRHDPRRGAQWADLGRSRQHGRVHAHRLRRTISALRRLQRRRSARRAVDRRAVRGRHADDSRPPRPRRDHPHRTEAGRFSERRRVQLPMDRAAGLQQRHPARLGQRRRRQQFAERRCGAPVDAPGVLVHRRYADTR